MVQPALPTTGMPHAKIKEPQREIARIVSTCGHGPITSNARRSGVSQSHERALSTCHIPWRPNAVETLFQHFGQSPDSYPTLLEAGMGLTAEQQSNTWGQEGFAYFPTM